MTSAKGAAMDGAAARKPGQNADAVPRKPSFKCGGPASRVTYRSVRALTNQFDLMSGQPRPSRLKSRQSVEQESISEQSCLAVRTAINIFEKASPTPEPEPDPEPAMVRPIAAIKPICKPNAKPKPKLVPKDSLCRARYNDMRRIQKETKVKTHKSDAAEQTGETTGSPSDTITINNYDEKELKKISGETFNPNPANWDDGQEEEKNRTPYTVQLRKQLSEKSFEALKDRLGKENISVTVQIPQKERILSENNLSQPMAIKNNNQTVFDQISQTRIKKLETKQQKERKFVALLKNNDHDEKLATVVMDEIKTPTDYIKPNMSFLWSTKPQVEEKEKVKTPINDTPLPKPPESFIPDCIYESIGEQPRMEVADQGIYDDIGAPSNNNSSLYCISDQLDFFNIYEDIGSVNIYETSDDTEITATLTAANHSEVYEQVCDDDVYHSICGESVLSSYEKNNSLYESADPATISGIGSQLGLITGSHHQNRTNSDDDTTTSDEWLEESDSEPEQSQINRRSKRHCNGKQRPNWAELQKRANEKTTNAEDLSVLNGDEEHVYECIPLPQSTETPANGLTDDAEEEIDDFESSNEEDNNEGECPDAQLPAEPSAQYNNIKRSLKAAGKRLRQNFTLRKTDLSKSFKNLRPRIRSNEQPESDLLNSKFYTDLRQTEKRYRPQSPPPPPPPAPSSLTSVQSCGDGAATSTVQYADVRVNGNDLYAECGLFKQRSRSTTLWYTEAGLYGEKEEAKVSPGRDFTDEPLYQFYTECVNAQARDDILQLDNDAILNHYYTLINDNRKTLDLKVPLQRSLPTFHTLNRTLWCQMPEVEASCIVPTLTEQQRKLQEAKFEIVTSEGSYIHSLNVLEAHFMMNLTELISPRDHKLLFTNILAVKAVSQRLLTDLESTWREDIMLMRVCDVITKHAQQDFEVYVKFCKHHSAVYRTLANLLETNATFAATVKQLESAQVCCGLSLHSFLLLPMQRITRLPLLLGAVLSRIEKQDHEYTSCKTAFEGLNKIVKECDEEATKMEKCEEMLLLSQQLVFPNTVRRIPVISGNRCLVKRGTATQLVGKEDSKLTFGRRLNKFKLHLLLFTDLLLLARSKGRGELSVVDFCARNLVQLEPSSGVTLGTGHVMLLTLLENHENKTVELMMSFSLESEVTRWQDALSPILSTNPMESIYEAWDCPQMIVIYDFTATQPDELSLAIGDIVNVLKKIPDGWYQGERLRDGARGWFPSNHVQEISSSHIRAKNKKIRYKLLSQIQQQLNLS